MSEKKRKQPSQNWLPFKSTFDKDYKPVGWRPKDVKLPGIEKIVKLKKPKDERMVRNYLAARDVVRNLQKMGEAIKERGYIDVEKEDKVNKIVRKILRGR